MSKIKCLECNMILESVNRYDFIRCHCENNTFLDGGNTYMRLGGKDLTRVAYWNEKENKFEKLKLGTKQKDEQLSLFEENGLF